MNFHRACLFMPGRENEEKHTSSFENRTEKFKKGEKSSTRLRYYKKTTVIL